MKINIDKSKWRKVQLGEVATEYSKRISNPSESEFERFVGSSNIEQWDFRINSWEPTDSVTSAMKLFEPDDYLLVRRSLYASDFRERAPRALFSGVCSGDILTIRENRKKIENGFLIAVLNNTDVWKYIVANASGSITRRIKWKDLSKYEFLLPPPNQQEELASFLWDSERLISKEKELIEKLEVCKKTMLKELESIEQGDIARIGDLIEIENGFAFCGKYITNEESEMLLMTPGNFRIGGGFSYNKLKYYTSKDFNPKFIFKPDDMVITMTDLSKACDTLGLPAKVPIIKDKVILHNQRLGKILFKNDKIIPDFLYYILQTQKYRRFIIMAAARTTVSHTSSERIKNYSFVIPDKSIQMQWVDRFKSIENCIDDVVRKIEYSKSLRQNFINQVF